MQTYIPDISQDPDLPRGIPSTAAKRCRHWRAPGHREVRSYPSLPPGRVLQNDGKL